MKNLLEKWKLMWFYQQNNGKIWGMSIQLTLVIVTGLLAGFLNGKDAANGFDVWYSLSTKIASVIWLIVTIGFAINALGKRSLVISEKYWRTSLVRMKDPKFETLKKRDPHWRDKEKRFEELWKETYNISYEKSEKPTLNQVMFLWPLFIVISFLIGLGIFSLV